MFSICITHDDFEVQSLLLIPPYKALLWFHSLSLCVRLVGVKRERVEIGGRKRGKRLKIFYSLARKKMLGIGIFHPRPPIWFLPSRGENDRRQ